MENHLDINIGKIGHNSTTRLVIKDGRLNYICSYHSHGRIHDQNRHHKTPQTTTLAVKHESSYHVVDPTAQSIPKKSQ